jgi:hypothetical protein
MDDMRDIFIAAAGGAIGTLITIFAPLDKMGNRKTKVSKRRKKGIY